MTIVTTQAHGDLYCLPFEPTVPIIERLQWFTEVHESHNGTEFRERLRARPRHFYRYTYAVQPHQIGKIFSGMANSYPWLIPVWSEAQVCGDVFGFGNYSWVVCDTTHTNWQVNAYVFVVDSTGQTSIHRVRKIEDEYIEIQGEGVSAGNRIMPALRAELLETREKTSNGYTETVTLEWELLDVPLREIEADEQFPSGSPQWDVWAKPNYQVQVTKQLSVKIDRTDFDVGIADLTYPHAEGRYRSTLRNVLRNPAEMSEYKRWLYRRCGKWRALWMPAYEQALRVVDKADNSNVVVEDDAYFEGRQYAVFRTYSTTTGDLYHYRVLNDPTPVSPNRISFTVNSIPHSLSAFRDGNYAFLSRLAVDEIEIHWRGNGVAESTVEMVGLVPLETRDLVAGEPTVPLAMFDHNTPKWQDLERTTLAAAHGDPVRSIANPGSLGGYFEFDDGVVPTLDFSTMDRFSLKFVAFGRYVLPYASAMQVTDAGMDCFVKCQTEASAGSDRKGPVGRWAHGSESDQDWFIASTGPSSSDFARAQLNAGIFAAEVVHDEITTGNDVVLNMRVSEDFVHFYVNGIESSNGPTEYTVRPNGDAPLSIGSISENSVSAFIGNISAFRLYGQQLSALERVGVHNRMVR